MKKLALFFGLFLASLASMSQNLPPYDFMVEMRDSNHASTGIVGDLYFKILPEDSTSVAIVAVVKDSGASRLGNTIYLPSAITNGNSDTSITYTVKALGDRSFAKLDMSGIVFPNTVEKIGKCAFDSASFLRRVDLPSSLRLLDSSAFAATHVVNLNFQGTVAQWLNVDIINDDATPMGVARHLKICDTLLHDLVIPEGFTTLKPYLFAWDTALRSVVFPSTMESIRSECFKYCSMLDSVYIPMEISYIGDRCFDRCLSLRVVNYNARRCDYAGTAGQSIFAGCVSLRTVMINEGVEKIPDYLFMYCNHVGHFSFPSTVRQVGKYAFAHTTGWPSRLTIGADIQEIGESAFLDCRGFDTLEFLVRECHLSGADFHPPFEEDTLASVLLIGGEVEVIPQGLFQGMRGIHHVSSFNPDPPYVAHSNSFEGVPDNAMLMVPCGSEEAYRSEFGWDHFRVMRPMEMFHYDVISEDSLKGTVEVIRPAYCEYLSTLVEAHPNQGYYFLRWSDGNTDPRREIEVSPDMLMVAYFGEGQGINDLDDGLNVFAQGRSIVVEGADGMAVAVCDVLGRVVAQDRSFGRSAYRLPAAGIYMVKVAGKAPRKIIVR